MSGPMTPIVMDADGDGSAENPPSGPMEEQLPPEILNASPEELIQRSKMLESEVKVSKDRW